VGTCLWSLPEVRPPVGSRHWLVTPGAEGDPRLGRLAFRFKPPWIADSQPVMALQIPRLDRASATRSRWPESMRGPQPLA